MDGSSFSDTTKELVASNPEPRNWKGIVISVLVILSVILMVALAVVWMTPPDPGPRVRGERIRLDQILEGKFKPNPFNATYIGPDILYIDVYGGLSLYNTSTHVSRVLMDNSTFRTLNSHSYSLSPDMAYVMITHDVQKIFRHSTLAKYTFQSLNDRSAPLVRLGVRSPVDLLQEQELLQHAEFLPNRGVLFVRNNDLYYLDRLPDGKVTRVTNSGVMGSAAIWMSGDGERILFAQFNDSNVEPVTLREYSGSGWKSGLKSKMMEKTFRYPKAGGRNPTVKLFMFSPGSDTVQPVHPPAEVQEQDHYLSGARWISSSSVCVVWMNRAQNTSYYTTCSQPDYRCKQIYVERTADQDGVGWVVNRGPPHFSSDGSKMVLIQPTRDGENGFFPQLVTGRVSTTDFLPLHQLTHGPFEVTRILGLDERNHLVYYLSTLVDRPGERHLLAVDISADLEARPVCLTTTQTAAGNLPLPAYHPCLYSRIHLSPTFNSYIQECLGPGIPFTAVFSLPHNTLLWIMDENSRLQDQVRMSSMPRDELLSIELGGNARGRARVKLTLPPVLRQEEEYKFPLIIHVYGGPGSQTVDTRWGVGWNSYLASRRDFIVANIDVRGSGFQGLSFKHAVYQKLGTLETEDTLAVVRKLVERLSFVDSTRVCIWGWSFGGYLAAMALAEDGRTLRQGERRTLACGIAVAPVTSWQNYDSAYTERFLGLPTPQGNWKGYSEASLMNKVETIQDSSFLLIHGTADDNVHVQHTMMLSKTLVQNHIIFRQQVYPDENHSLQGVAKHHHETMEAFLDDVFGPLEDFFKDDYYLAAANLMKHLDAEDCYIC